MSHGRFGEGRSPRLPGLALALAALGFCLAHGSAAQAGAATVNPVQTTTYQLDPGKNPITFGPHTKIQVTSGDGVFDNSSTKWTIVNYGLIAGGGTNGFGLWTAKATKLTNYGTISGPALGVALQTGSSVTNADGASILGGLSVTGTATITNFGTITNFLELNDGTVTNKAGGVISADTSTALFPANAANVTNFGVISNTGGDAMYLGNPSIGRGSLNNTKTGRITAAGVAVDSQAGSMSLTNAGLIQGAEGVAMLQGGKLTNQSGGMISGTSYGVGDFSSQPGHASTIVNQAHATIEGDNEAINFPNAGPTTLTNAGTITSPRTGIVITGGSITNPAGGGVSGPRASIYVTTNPVSITNAGQITGEVELAGGGSITNSKTGVISGFIDNFGASPVTFSNAGVWQLATPYGLYTTGGGTITNTGVIEVLAGESAPQSFEIYGLASFRNGSSSTTGTINLSNGIVGDALRLDQPFAAANGHSVLILDAFLGGPGSQADQLHLTTGSSGQTLIRIHDTNTGEGAVNSAGIVLVTGATAAGDFALDPKGPGYDKKNKGIDHGLYLYNLQFNSGNEVLVGTAAPAAHQLATSLSAGQTILTATDFSPSSSSSGGAGFMGFTGGGPVGVDRPMFWTSAVNTLSSNPLQQGRYVGRPGGGQVAAPPALRLSAIQSSAGMDTGYDQGLAMLKGGVDLIRHRDGERSFSLGLGTAYVQSDQRFTDGGAAMFYSGAVYGAYADYRSGAAYLNASFKSAMLKAQYQAPWLNGPTPYAGLTATGLQVDGGFTLRLAHGWSLQPVASMAASRISMADLSIAGETARFNAGYTGWANVGAQLAGTTFLGAYELQSRFTAKVWDRFGDNSAYLAGLGPEAPLVDRISGVSGEVAAELRLSAGSNLHAFAQTSARAGAAQTAATALAGLSFSW